MAGNNGYYRTEVVVSSAAYIIESNCAKQYIQGGGMVPYKPEDHNSYKGQLGGQIGVMCAIKIMEHILGSTTLMVNIWENISILI